MSSMEIAPITQSQPLHRQGLRDAMQSLVLEGVTSPHTRRAYEQALEEFLIWLCEDGTQSFTKAAVQKYRSELHAKGLAPASINLRMCATRKLALEAADNGLLALDIAAGIERVKGARRCGVRLGRWLTSEEAERLLTVPDVSTVKGARDAALLAVLLGSGLRRSEIVALTFEHIQKKENRWVIADLVGKHDRIRTVPIAEWVVDAIERWSEKSGLRQGYIFRAVDKSSRVCLQPLSSHAVFSIVRRYARQIGLGVSPHDLRRTFAHLAYDGKAALEQIQFSLGHASVVTTEIYLGARQNLRDAPCDHLGLNEDPGLSYPQD